LRGSPEDRKKKDKERVYLKFRGKKGGKKMQVKMRKPTDEPSLQNRKSRGVGKLHKTYIIIRGQNDKKGTEIRASKEEKRTEEGEKKSGNLHSRRRRGHGGNGIKEKGRMRK